MKVEGEGTEAEAVTGTEIETGKDIKLLLRRHH